MPLWAVLDPTASPSGHSQGCSTQLWLSPIPSPHFIYGFPSLNASATLTLFYPSWVVGLAPPLSPISFPVHLFFTSISCFPFYPFLPSSSSLFSPHRLPQLTPSASLSSKGLRLIQTASPRNGLTTQILGVTILLTQPRKQSWVWGPDLEPACTIALAVLMQELRAPGTRKPLPGPISRNSLAALPRLRRLSFNRGKLWPQQLLS